MHQAGAAAATAKGGIPILPDPERGPPAREIKEQIRPTKQAYQHYEDLLNQGHASSVEDAFNDLLMAAMDVEAGRPTAIVSIIKLGIHWKQRDGSWKGCGPGYWAHSAIASALFQANFSWKGVTDLEGSGRATCCPWHIEKYDCKKHGQTKEALMAGSAETMLAWKATIESRRAQGYEIGIFWGDPKPVPEFPPSSDVWFGSERREHMRKSWESHGKIGPMESWDPECWNPIYPEPHLGPWYFDYAEVFMADPDMQMRKGHSEVARMLSLVKAMTPAERREIQQRVNEEKRFRENRLPE